LSRQTGLRFQAALRAASVAVLIIFVDRITKFLVIRTLDVHESVTVIRGFFSLTHLQNRAGVFGLGPKNPLLFTIASFVALLFLGYLFTTLDPRRRLHYVAFGLIMGGAVGNLIDRIWAGERVFHGAVTDFLDFSIAGHHWPPFNVADSAITIGVGLFLLTAFLLSRREVAHAPDHS
jgi:signal peptidase II